MKKIISLMLAVLMIFSALSVTAAAATTKYKVGDIIAFGSYPQSKVNDSATLDALNKMSLSWKSYGYYSGNGEDESMTSGDWMKYADVTYGGEKYRCVYFTQYRPTVTKNKPSANKSNQDDNGYYTNTNYWFKFEPIKWRVLDPESKLVISETILDSQAYSNTLYKKVMNNAVYYYNDSKKTVLANDYATSSIRAWLNNDFYNAAFTSEQKKSIKTATVDNTSYQGKISRAATKDKIFLLSYDEMKNEKYGISSFAFNAQGSDYAKSQGLSVYSVDEYKGNSDWFLRTAKYDGGEEASCVRCSKKIDGNYHASSTFGGVRPAMKLDILTSHTHSFSLNSVKKATASADGAMTYTCSCGSSYSDPIKKVSTIKLSKTNYVYDGKVKTPTVTVKDSGKNALKEGTDYTVTYSKGRKEIGTYSVKIAFKGNYTGTKTLEFKIVKAMIAGKVGDIIEFGSYPQSEVTDSKLLAKLNKQSLSWKSYGYYSGNGEDGSMEKGSWMKYADVTYGGEKYRCVYFSKYRPAATDSANSAKNSNQDNNGYLKKTKYWFKFEPIKWRVLDPVEGLVMSETILDAQPFTNTFYKGDYSSYYFSEEEGAEYYYYFYNNSKKTIYANDYATSSIRSWLNADFYKTAFTDMQKNQIVTTKLDNNPSRTSKDDPYFNRAATNDKIFLLSEAEIENKAYGFKSVNYADTARRAQGSDYAKCQGLWVYNSEDFAYRNGNSYWRLRTPEFDKDYSGSSGLVDTDGHAVVDVFNNNTSDDGIRPALKLNASMFSHAHSFTSKVTKKATATEDGKIKYTCTCGLTYTKTIKKVSTIKLSKTSYNYSGKAKKPTVTVKNSSGNALKEGTNYTLTYSKGRTQPGTYSVKVTFKGKYSGTKTLKFKIVEPAKPSKLTSVQSTSAVKLTWSKVSGAKGYRVYQYNTKTKKYVKLADTANTTYKVKNLKAGTQYKFAVKAYAKAEGKTLWGTSSKLTTATKTKAPTLKAAAGSKKATLSWNKISGATGYVVYMATSKDGDFKKVTAIKKAATVKYTMKDLTKGKTYYFKVRAYKTVDGKNIYSAYSDIVKVKVK